MSFHRFPKQPERRALWLELSESDIKDESTRVCSRHFPNGDSFKPPSLTLGKLMFMNLLVGRGHSGDCVLPAFFRPTLFAPITLKSHHYLWEERKSKLYGDVECAQQPRPHSPTGDLGEIAGINGQNSEGMCQGGKPGTGKLYTEVCLCCSAHTSGCVVDGLGATAAF